MTEAVATNGFVVPPGGSSTVVDGSKPNIPPSNPQPGFVVPPITPAPSAPAGAEPEASKVAPKSLEATVAALTAALAAQNATKQPAPAATPDADSLNAFDPNVLQDPVLRSMATVMQTVGKGIDMDRVFSKALETGNAEFIDVAYLRDSAGENAEQLITIAQGIIQAVNAQASAMESKVYGLAGSEAQWNACTAAFNTGAPEAIKQVVATMLNSGVNSQIEAAAGLVVEFAKGSGFVPNANPLVQSGGAAMPASQALSKDEFQAELRKLNPNDRGFEKARGELFARRQAGKQLGK